MGNAESAGRGDIFCKIIRLAFDVMALTWIWIDDFEDAPFQEA
jgi:hypothetical protein